MEVCVNKLNQLKSHNTYHPPLYFNVASWALCNELCLIKYCYYNYSSFIL